MRRVAFWLSLIPIFTMPWEAIIVFPGVGTITRSLGMLLTGFWLLTVLVTARFRRLEPVHGIILLFFLWGFVSFFWTMDPDRTLALMGVDRPYYDPKFGSG